MNNRTAAPSPGLRTRDMAAGLSLAGLVLLALAHRAESAPEPGPAPPPPTAVSPSPPAADPDGSPPAPKPIKHPSINEDALPGPPPEVKELGEGRYRVGRVMFDSKKKTITIPATVHMEAGPVEYVLVTKKGKMHETVLVTDADPSHVHLAALLLGIQPEKNLGPKNAAAPRGKTGVVEAWIEWERNGPPARHALTETVALSNTETKQIEGTLTAGLWLYNGSRVSQGSFLASTTGSIISIIRDPEALINNPGASRDNDDIHVPNATLLPKLQTPVRVVLRMK